MIRVQAAGDHPVAYNAHAPLLDHPAGPLTLAVPVQQQRHHHLRIERRPPVPVRPAPAAEPAQIQRGHRIQDHEHQIVLRQPPTHVHRQQQRLCVGDDWTEDHHDIEVTDQADQVLARGCRRGSPGSGSCTS
jgi:hypothetical protein